MRKQGCEAFCAEIRLDRLSHKRAEAIHDSSPKQAKRSFFRKANAKNLNKTAKDSRICDEKVGLCSGEQGDKTSGLSTQRATNSLLYRAKPNPPKR